MEGLDTIHFDTRRAPTLDEIEAAHRWLRPHVRHTPCVRARAARIEATLGAASDFVLKLESFQHAGSFKVRAALLILQRLADDAAREERPIPGVCAVSAGNHAIALAWAARRTGARAKIVMPESANPARVERVRALGAELELVPDVHVAFDRCRAIERDEERVFVHPFEGPWTALGTATLGLEWWRDAEAQACIPDAVVVPIGGGGLMAGVACAFRQLSPKTRIYGVEPSGADTMRRSFADGAPAGIERVSTIADSLGAPHAAPYSFGLCRDSVDALVQVDDEALRDSMRWLWDEFALALEPAAAAATAACFGPLAPHLAGCRVGVLVCGSNIDPSSLASILARREA